MRIEKTLYVFIRTMVVIALILVIQNYLKSIDWNRMVLSDLWISVITMVKNFLYGFIIMHIVFHDIHLQGKSANYAVQSLILIIIFILSIWDILTHCIAMPEILYRLCAENSTYFQLLLGMWISQIMKDHFHIKA